jgi:hypothetical protein
MSKQLEYPIGSFISWCDDYYKVKSNTDDYKGMVIDMSGDLMKFYFDFKGEKAQLITDINKIKELQEMLSNNVSIK